MRRFWRIFGRILILALLVPVVISAEDVIPCASEFIVKTQNPEALQCFAGAYGIELASFITYPDPSSEVLERFGCYWVASIQCEREARNLMDGLRALPGVELVEPNLTQQIEFSESRSYVNPPDTFYHPYTPNDPRFPEQWDKIITQTDWAWNLTTGEGVIIAILDTGADTDHEDLEANLVPGYNFVSDTTDIEDDFGHGTHVSGIAAAKIDNGKGIAGMAGNCTIMPVKVIDSTGDYTNANLAQGIIYAADNGAHVINMSLGGKLPSVVIEDAVNYAWEAGLFLYAAAGNDREERSDYPAAYERVMSVGATTSGDSRWQYSNYGESVAIFAPGGGYEGILSTEKGGYYGWRDGTSMACPQVAGLAALIASVHPEYTNQDVWDKMIASADTIPVSRELRINSRVALDIVEVAETEGTFMVSVPGIQKGRIRFACRASGSASYTLRLFDVTGREVYATRGEITLQGKIDCVPVISQGVYFWMVETDAGSGSGKFIYFD